MAGDGLPKNKFGKTHPLTLELEGIHRKFIVNAIAIKELNDDVNLRSTFLLWIGRSMGTKPQLTFHKNGVLLNVGGGTIELINTVEKKPMSQLGPDLARGRTQESNMDKKREESIGGRQVELSIFTKSHLRLKINTSNVMPIQIMKSLVFAEPVYNDMEFTHCV